MVSLSSFEILPDEMILYVCHYLRGADILYSFYNLNTRLNITITGYCRYVNLMAVSYKQFDYAVSNVLPQIGSSVRTFVLNGNWETIICDRLSSILFTSRLSFLLPRLQRITVKWFTSERLFLFVDILQDFLHLTQLDLRYLKGRTIDSLLTKVLSANNGRLSIVSFDQDSIDLDISDNCETISYPNIEELTVNLTISELIPRLFRLIPNVRRLYLSVDELSDSSQSKLTTTDLSSLVYLIDFQLRSINLFWTFEEISHILKAMPSLQKLALDFRTDDERLINEDDLITILPSSLLKINFVTRYYFSEPESDVKTLNTAQSARFSIAYLLDEPRHRYLIHTIPCDLRTVIIPATIAKQMTVGWGYMQQMEDLYIYDTTSLLDILLILQHFRRLRTLSIDLQDSSQIRKYLRSQYFTWEILLILTIDLFSLSSDFAGTIATNHFKITGSQAARNNWNM
jgi:hypothetical protein